MSTCEVNLGASDIIAISAVLIAGLSAIYARWAWCESRRSNEISLSGHRKEIYDAFFEIKMHMQQKAEFAQLSEVSKLFYPSRNASLYLRDELANQISSYYEACFWVADIHRSTGGLTTESMDKCRLHLEAEEDLAPKIDSALSRLIKKIND
ncbi:hypothetical protein FW757_03090 [Pseudoalteromonas sp. 1181_04]